MKSFAAAWKAAGEFEKTQERCVATFNTGLERRKVALLTLATVVDVQSVASSSDTPTVATVADFASRAVLFYDKEVSSIDVNADRTPGVSLFRELLAAVQSWPSEQFSVAVKTASATLYNCGASLVNKSCFDVAVPLLDGSCTVWEAFFGLHPSHATADAVTAAQLPSKLLALVTTATKQCLKTDAVITSEMTAMFSRLMRWHCFVSLSKEQSPLFRPPRDFIVSNKPTYITVFSQYLCEASGLGASDCAVPLVFQSTPILRDDIPLMNVHFPSLECGSSGGSLTKELASRCRLILLVLLSEAWWSVGDWRKAVAMLRKACELAATVSGSFRSASTSALQCMVTALDSARGKAACASDDNVLQWMNQRCPLLPSTTADIPIVAESKRKPTRATGTATAVKGGTGRATRNRKVNAEGIEAAVEVARATPVDSDDNDGLTDALGALSLVTTDVKALTDDEAMLRLVALAGTTQTPDVVIPCLVLALNNWSSFCCKMSGSLSNSLRWELEHALVHLYLVTGRVSSALDRLAALPPIAHCPQHLQFGFHIVAGRAHLASVDPSVLSKLWSGDEDFPCSCSSIAPTDRFFVAAPAMDTTRKASTKMKSSQVLLSMCASVCLARSSFAAAMSAASSYRARSCDVRDAMRSLALVTGPLDLHRSSLCTEALSDASFLLQDSMATGVCAAPADFTEDSTHDTSLSQFSSLQSALLILPDPWTVCTISITPMVSGQSSLLLTRLPSCHSEVQLPSVTAASRSSTKKQPPKKASPPSVVCRQSPFGSTVLLSASSRKDAETPWERFSEHIARNAAQVNGNTTDSVETWTVDQKRQWWKDRLQLDADMVTTLQTLEHSWLGLHKCWLLGKVVSEDTRKIMTNAVQDAVFSDASVVVKHSALLHAVVNACDVLSEDEIRAGLSCACSTAGVFDDFAFADAAGILKSAASSCVDWRRAPVILVLDDTLHHVPWECMPMFQSATVTRMPSLSLLLAALRRPVTELPSPLPVVSVLNPGNDLPRTVAAMTPVLHTINDVLDIALTQYANSCPPSTDLASTIRKCVCYLYFGHGAGEPYLKRDDLMGGDESMLHWSLLMGCSSVAVKKHGWFGADGAVHAYLAAGSRCVVGNLWDVTDKDIDAYTDALLRQWLLESDGIAHKTAAVLTQLLLRAVHSKRGVCKLKHAVGAAPVVYGLPC